MKGRFTLMEIILIIAFTVCIYIILNKQNLEKQALKQKNTSLQNTLEIQKYKDKKKSTFINKFLLMYNKWFTLIEMIIVMWVISILVTLSTPSIKEYLERSKVITYQRFASEMIREIQSYRSEVGEISRWTPLSWDWFCFTQNPEVWCDTTYRHIWMSSYLLKNNPKLLKDIEILFQHDTDPSSEDLWYENLDLPFYQSTWWINFPGKDMTSTSRVPAFVWRVPYAIWVEEWWYTRTGSNMPKSADNICSPGIAWMAMSLPSFWFGAIDCIYLFE